MLTRLRQVRRDERGMSMVYVGMGFMAFLSATTLAIDVGMFMTARTQAQTSADAGALAGAVALAFNDFNDRSSSGPAVQSALNSARPNQVISGTVSVTPADVTFPTDPSRRCAPPRRCRARTPAPTSTATALLIATTTRCRWGTRPCS